MKLSPRLLQRVPLALTCSRFALGPLLVLGVVRLASPWLLMLLLAAAMLSDIFDGVVARRLKIATEPLRVLDSYADAFFFGCVGLAALLTVRGLLWDYRLPIGIECVLQISAYLYDLTRYGRITSLHAYSAKLWGLSLYLAAAEILIFHTGVLIWLAFATGLVSAVDALAIKLILPGWQHDILSFRDALRKREHRQALEKSTT